MLVECLIVEKKVQAVSGALTSAIMINKSSYPYLAAEIHLAMRRKITATVEANIMTTMIAITSVCRLSLREGTVLLHSACARPRPAIV